MTAQPASDSTAKADMNRRALLTGAALTYSRHLLAQIEKNYLLAGKSINMGIAGSLPSQLGVDMSGIT